MTKKFIKVLLLTIAMAISATMFAGFGESVNAADDIVYYGGHSYQRFDIRKTWTEAEAYAESLGGHLVTISSQEENDVVYNLIKDGIKNQYWIGSADSKSWITGEKWDYTNWIPGEPNGVNGPYVAMNRIPHPTDPVHSQPDVPGKWHDISNDCNWDAFWHPTQVGFVVEKEPQLKTPTKLKLAKKKASWKKVANNNGYILKVIQGKKTIFKATAKKNTTNYKFTKKQRKKFKKGKKYYYTLVAKGAAGKYANSKAGKSKAVKMK